MTEQDKQRIETAQDQAAKEWNSAFDYRALRNGVQVGNIKMHYLDEVNKRAMEIYGERMAELLKEQIELVSTREAEQDVMAADTVRLMDQIEYQKKALKEYYDKITKLEFGLKQERNKVIDEVGNLFFALLPVGEVQAWDFVKASKSFLKELESLKGKSQ